MDAHIHHHGPGLDVLGPQHQRFAGRHHQHIGLAGDRSQVLGAGVGHGDRGIGGLEHQGHGLAHQDAAAHHHGPLAGQLHAMAGQQGHHAGGGAAARAGLALEQVAQVEGVQAVGVLGGIDRRQQGPLLEAGG